MIQRLKSSVKDNRALMNIFYSFRFFVHGNKKNFKGENNSVHHFGALLDNVNFNVTGDNNIIYVGIGSSIKNCNFNIRGNNHRVEIGEGGIFVECNFATEDHDCLIKIGNDATMFNKGEIAAVEPFSKIEIGDGCMFSNNVDIRNTDSHSILDNVTKKRINPGANVKMGDRVWIGAHAQILKGVTIGNDCVVGIRSLVNKDVPSNSVVVGIPAKVVKSDICWIKERI